MALQRRVDAGRHLQGGGVMAEDVERGMSGAAPAGPADEADGGRAELLARIRRLERASRGLEPGTSSRKRLRGAVLASSERFLRAVDGLHAFQPGDAAGLLELPIGERGAPLEEVMELLEREVVRPGGHPASPGHLAYIPGGGIYHSALADYFAAVTNKYAGIFFTGPGPVRMENQLVRWAADLVGYPAGAGGSIASGGSLATLTAVTTARDAHRLRGADYASAVVYLTTQAHHAVEKALRIAGLGEAERLAARPIASLADGRRHWRERMPEQKIIDDEGHFHAEDEVVDLTRARRADRVGPGTYESARRALRFLAPRRRALVIPLGILLWVRPPHVGR